VGEPEPSPTHPPRRAAGRGRARLALAFAVAALAASWNPIAAPFGFVVAIGAALLSIRSLRAGGRRRLTVAALCLSILAFVASGAILVATAGSVGTELSGERVVKGRSAEELDRALSEAASRTRAERERAARELRSRPAPAAARESEHRE
jgi:hypothetical protein